MFTLFLQQLGDHAVNLDYDGTNALYLPTATEASSPEDNVTAAVRSKYDEEIDADPTLPPVWSQDTLAARVSVEIAGDVTPSVVSVSCPLTPGGNTSYGVGETIDLDVLFTTRVFVKDSVSKPHLLVEAGEERRGEAQVRRESRRMKETFGCQCPRHEVRTSLPSSPAVDAENISKPATIPSMYAFTRFIQVCPRSSTAPGLIIHTPAMMWPENTSNSSANEWIRFQIC